MSRVSLAFSLWVVVFHLLSLSSVVGEEAPDPSEDPTPSSSHDGKSPRSEKKRHKERVGGCMDWALSGKELFFKEKTYTELKQCEQKNGKGCDCRDETGHRLGVVTDCKGNPMAGGGVACHCECQYENLTRSGKPRSSPSCNFFCSDSDEKLNQLCLEPFEKWKPDIEPRSFVRPNFYLCPTLYIEESVQAKDERLCCKKHEGECEGWSPQMVSYTAAKPKDAVKKKKGTWTCEKNTWIAPRAYENIEQR